MKDAPEAMAFSAQERMNAAQFGITMILNGAALEGMSKDEAMQVLIDTILSAIIGNVAPESYCNAVLHISQSLRNSLQAHQLASEKPRGAS